MQWTTLFRKEMLENWRNYKWVWVPLVIITLAIMDPITTYYLPQIIESVGGLPEGATIDIPTPVPYEVVMMSLSQLSSLGVLIIVLISMGVIASERKSGVLELVLVKPVAYRNYVTAKWASLLLLTWTSLILGMLASWYYINLLFGELSFLSLIQVIFFYGCWLSFVVSLTIFYNTFVKSPGLVAFLTIATIMVMSVVTNIFEHVLTWSPNLLSTYIQEMLLMNQIPTELVATMLVTVACSILLITGSVFMLKTKEMAN